MARPEVASSKAGSVPERPGRGRGPGGGSGPSRRASAGPRSWPTPLGAERRPQLPAQFARPPSALHHMEIYILGK